MINNDSTQGFENQVNAGSSGSGEPVFLVVGKLRRPHGVRGEIQMEVFTDFPERLRAGKRVFVGDEHKPMILGRVRGHDNLLIVTLRGYDTREEVEGLRNQLMFVRAENLPSLGEGEFYHHELVGLKVVDPDSGLNGVLVEILETGSNDVYVVRDQTGEEILLPAIKDVIVQIDIQNRVIRVHQPEYL